MRVSGEGVGLLESTFEVIGYFCLQQFAFVGFRRIYYRVIRILSYDGPVARFISFLHEETGKFFSECSVLGAPSHSVAGPGQVQ